MTEQIINDNVEINENTENEIQETNLIKISEIAEDYSNIIIEKYIPYIVKSTMIKNILNTVVTENTQGLKTINYPLLSLAKEIVIFNNYSNVDISQEDTVFVYDELKKSGAIDFVLENISPDELYFFDEVILHETQQLFRVENSVSNVLAKTLNTLIEKIPDQKSLAKLIKDLPKQINKIDQSKLKYVSEAIGWNNGKEKS
jgi:hypothetical protein